MISKSQIECKYTGSELYAYTYKSNIKFPSSLEWKFIEWRMHTVLFSFNWVRIIALTSASASAFKDAYEA